MANDSISRRAVVGGAAAAGIGLTAGGAAMASGQSTSADGPPATGPLQDPTTKYVKPPFQRQSQPFPGLASKMRPRPDHGETSYKGSGRLMGRKALITGGDSGMGRAAAIAFAREGADVAIAYLPAEEEDAREVVALIRAAGRKALITGGDSGMGRAAAIAFAREGADVAIAYLPAEEEDAREVVALIRAAGRKAVTLPGDNRDVAHCRHMVQSAVDQLGGLDILVNNASRQQERQSLLDISDEDFDATMKTNLYGMFWITKAALPHLKPGSAIIQTTSEQAYDPSKDLVDYAMTKAAMMNFTKSLAKQLAPKGIRVNGVAPGPIWTPLQVAGGATMEKLEQFGGQTPLGRPGQPAELASIYVQLAADDASYAVGQVYGAAGGSGQP